MASSLIELRNISKSFDDTLVLDDFNLTVNENEFITLLGPSGCGKTTTLRIVGGFEMPDSGQVFFEGKDITNVPPNKRHLNTVFQKYALFPHMSIEQNIAFGLKISGKSEQYIKDKVKYALKLVNLDGFEKRKVDSLSGGQQQRIAMARAIVNEPKLLLLDEPLGALDLKLRQDMQYELIRLKNELGITFLYVTHDQEEALTMSDKVVVMNGGRIQQMGTPEQIYNEPENAFVADFIGDSNIIDGVMVEDRVVKICDTVFPCIDEGFGRNKPVDVVIRPEDLIIGKPGAGKLDGEVTHNVFIGVHYEMEIEAGGYTWLAQNTESFPVGTKVSLDVDADNIQIMHKPQTKEEEAIELDV
ncbi:MAG: ABC transporter ATP-binding protein [Emergencia sp.]